MKTVLILGSARRNGDTAKKAVELQKLIACEIIDLLQYQISGYDYDYRNPNDDFIPLLKYILKKYDALIFATPVYWYAMSGLMKTFFDRLTDVLTIEKELGDTLKGKTMAVLSCSNGNHLNEHFWLPFKYTAEYLDMKYLGHVHTIANAKDDEVLRKFALLFKADREPSIPRKN